MNTYTLVPVIGGRNKQKTNDVGLGISDSESYKNESVDAELLLLLPELESSESQ
jgi:hypothetical protein